jgi:hypothetical protein
MISDNLGLPGLRIETWGTRQCGGRGLRRMGLEVFYVRTTVVDWKFRREQGVSTP